jgi:exopolysaccharide biosynthesis predicted pyruvyltransferase EpsI
MALDKSGLVRAYFRFRILKRAAVDEDLYLDITKRPLQSTNSIQKHFRHIGIQKFVNDVIEYLIHVKYENATAEPRLDLPHHFRVQQEKVQAHGDEQHRTHQQSKQRLVALGKHEIAKASYEEKFDFEKMRQLKTTKKGEGSLKGFGLKRCHETFR